ncbi:hypothetical protein [Mycobacterium montefiorense]|uniref:DUF2505 domain-containing protein n=1 Tax=Mycobacterium montefiorense TaxID=154654 RepID=A0ABQ0NMK8_9MYCO|nr:hypothetical protein [Mycobacterium montefiorense]GBG38127.1 hypothetical protein MmonteBS_24990 [Mycobacterium montefiorense]GKU33723.1 hypothetical protein NJB14191_10700 [Mycobacterium montefiorense]GKU39842.1 hypothetical protein NJB14192_18320 [Mycobacterium montefiorense]GKU43649.1 hypothetical protein NJB14194_02820 [Mycobacterium montefiorense]GKU51669.1 hypothetical protein NJB14195_29140 [Mycobacterium montefiorense]
MAVFVRRLLGIGKLPDDLHAQVEAEGLLYLADFVAVTRRFGGVIPGVRLPHSVAYYTGSLVLTRQRVLATLSMLPKLAGVTVDVPWDAAQAGAATAEIASEGLEVNVDVAQVDERFSGELSLQYKAAIPADVLSGLPLRSLTFDMTPDCVVRAVGVTYSP